jgi:hypothetical protein
LDPQRIVLVEADYSQASADRKQPNGWEFRTAVSIIVGDVMPEGDDPVIILTHLLRGAELWRLADLGVRPEQAEVLVSSERRLGDAWFAYLTLATNSVIDDLTK